MLNPPPIPPFMDSFFSDLADKLEPPAWVKSRMQHQLVLLLNHVLMQEEEATRRLAQQSGHTARVQWRKFVMVLRFTPAGLLELLPEDGFLQQADLNITVSQPSALAIAREMLRGERPDIHIEGDVSLAGDVHWVIENVRWDIEEDMARLVGDTPAHALGKIGRGIREAISRFSNKGSV